MQPGPRTHLAVVRGPLIIAFALVFVLSFAVFPSAVMLGQPAGLTRTISIDRTRSST